MSRSNSVKVSQILRSVESTRPLAKRFGDVVRTIPYAEKALVTLIEKGCKPSTLLLFLHFTCTAIANASKKREIAKRRLAFAKEIDREATRFQEMEKSLRRSSPEDPPVTSGPLFGEMKSYAKAEFESSRTMKLWYSGKKTPRRASAFLVAYVEKTTGQRGTFEVAKLIEAYSKMLGINGKNGVCPGGLEKQVRRFIQENREMYWHWKNLERSDDILSTPEVVTIGFNRNKVRQLMSRIAEGDTEQSGKN